MEFAGVSMITLSEGEISSLHIGLKGTMNAMFLKDLADKTRRGLRGRMELGKSGGGIAYGYRTVKQVDANGERVRGDREIDPAQAAIVVRIFEEYALSNKSPKAIAAQLNAESIPCPSGREWGQSTINGNRRRGTGILNNELYIGQLVWNRQRFIKDPATGKRVTRLNPESEWVHKDVPALRNVDQALWDAAKARQKDLDQRAPGFWERQRPQYLLSGLLKCGQCGGGFSKINANRYGCSSARNKGASVCTNKKTIKRDDLEAAVLGALQTHLMPESLVQIFCEEYTRHLNALRRQMEAGRSALKADLARLRKERENIIRAIKDGVAAALVKDDLAAVAARQAELEEALAQAPKEPRPLIHPAMARRYRAQVKAPREALGDTARQGEAAALIRGLVEKVVLTPEEGKDDLAIDLYGDLAGILEIAAHDNATEDHPMKKRQGIEKPARFCGCQRQPQRRPVYNQVGSGGRI
jgi:site-specific DNA recombinase